MERGEVGKVDGRAIPEDVRVELRKLLPGNLEFRGRDSPFPTPGRKPRRRRTLAERERTLQQPVFVGESRPEDMFDISGGQGTRRYGEADGLGGG